MLCRTWKQVRTSAPSASSSNAFWRVRDFATASDIRTSLRHVVERTLQGQTSDLKERTLGIDVFGRSPDYDPAADPVVRVSAGEIRKRIAQYYHEPGHETEIRIDLPLGSYLPEFHFPRSKSIWTG